MYYYYILYTEIILEKNRLNLFGKLNGFLLEIFQFLVINRRWAEVNKVLSDMAKGTYFFTKNV